MIFKILIILTTSLYSFSSFSQNENVNNNILVETGVNVRLKYLGGESNLRNFYIGIKKEIGKSNHFLLRSGFIHTFLRPNYPVPSVHHYRNFVNLGIEYQFLNKVEKFSPFIGADIIYVKRKGEWGNSTRYVEIDNGIGGALTFGLRFNHKKFFIGIEADIGLTYGRHFMSYSSPTKYLVDDYKQYMQWTNRKPILFVGYKF